MAAYRAGDVMHDARTGETFDYRRKMGVLYSEVIAPADAPDWARAREELWNRSEAAHRRADAVVAREIQLSLPHELDNAQRRELTTGFARFLADRYNVAVDTCIHAPNRDGDERNYHAHLMICTRAFDAAKAQGLGNNVRAFDAVAHQRAGQQNEVELWRETWARQMNDALSRADVQAEGGATVTVDHRSYQRQGVDQEPTIKEGTAATALKRRGESTERVEQNDTIRERNQERSQERTEAEQLAREVEAATRQLDTLKRRAQQMTADQVRAELTPTNDNRRDYEKPLPWETEADAKAGAAEAVQREQQRREEERQREQQRQQRDKWSFGR